MKHTIVSVKVILVFIFLILSGEFSIFGQSPQPEKRFSLFLSDKSCMCIKTKKATNTVKGSIVRVGNSGHEVLYQVFWTSTLPKRELFRVDAGAYVEDNWNYGIVDEGDFDGDGVPDYSWYGGDDTAQEMYLFLSSGGKYQRVDILSTVKAAWQRKYHSKAPDIEDTDCDFEMGSIILLRSAKSLTIKVSLVREVSLDKPGRTVKLSIDQTEFKP